jgi:hypothetical protein
MGLSKKLGGIGGLSDMVASANQAATTAAVNIQQNIAAELREKYPNQPIPDLIVALQAKHSSETRVTPVKEVIPAYPPEGAVAFSRALKKQFGWTDAGNSQMVAIPIGVGEVERVPWGSVVIPSLSGVLRTNVVWERGNPVFSLEGEVRAHEISKVEALGKLVREELAANSIYKGKAVLFDLPKIADEDEREHMSVEDFCPKFVTLDPSLTEEMLVLSADTDESVHDMVFAPVKFTEAFREHNIPLRNGVILYGPYGCGKTLIAAILANLCVGNRWTFVEVNDVRQLTEAYKFAQDRSPAVLQLEDIDRLIDTGDPEDVTKVRNVLDGVGTKKADVLVVVTTNFPEKLPESLVRAGRLGAHLRIPPPDSEAAAKLLRIYAAKYLAANADLGGAGRVLEGRVPAMLRDVVEQAKRRSIVSGRGLSVGSMLPTDIESTGRRATKEFDDLVPIPTDTRDPMERGLDHIAGAIKEGMEAMADSGYEPEGADLHEEPPTD